MAIIASSIEVLDIRLVHFARIMAGLQLPELYINFEEMENPFYLFIGVNGSGKTSILHSIHPFAYNNAVGDSVPSSEFIIEGLDGSKSIRYRVDHDIYTIYHTYTRGKDSMGVKSFISKNGDELNPSGTTGTFKEIVYDVFGLDEAYLGLLSLGNTVANFVEFTGGTRKQLMSKIFTAIGVYNRYYKHASEKARSLKSLLTNVTVKLDKYRNFDKADATNMLSQLDKKIDNLTNESKQLTSQTGSLNQKILSHNEFMADYEAKKTAFFELVDRLDSLKKKVTTSSDEPTLIRQIEDLEYQINQKKINKGSYELNLNNALDYVQELNGSLNDLNNAIQKMTTDVDLNEIDMVIADLQDKIISLNVAEEPKLDREKLVRSNIYLDELKGMCASFIADVQYTDIVADTVKKYIKDSSLIGKSQTKYDKLVEELKTISYINGTQVMLGANQNYKIEYTCETGECPYKKFYETYRESVEKTANEIDKDISIKQQKIDVAKDIITIGNITSNIMKFISMNKDVFELPKDIFNPETFIELYMSKREVADMDLLLSLIDIAEKQEERENLLSQLRDAETKRKNNEALRENYNSLQMQKDSLEEKIERSKKSIDHYQSSIPTFDAAIKQFEDIKKQAEVELEAIRGISECKAEMTTLKTILASMESKSTEVEQLRLEMHKLTVKRDEIDKEISSLRDEREKLSITLVTIKNLEKEQETLMDEYEDAEVIKDAVSPSKGVPLERIKKFIKGDLISMVNDLLELVYKGDLYINPREVIINESEFTIPYRKKGQKVSDISMASDGERAILGVAFSLSLARTTSNKYNVLLLDEKDTALDIYSRGKYIDIIDAYRKIINCKQAFIVTHNAMFDNYPVNVIMTSDMEVSYQTDNILKLWR